MQVKTFFSYNPKHRRLYKQILDLLCPINDTYPEYDKWFNERFIAGLKKKERMYIIAQSDDNALAGCVLIKKTPAEKKICTFYIHPEFRKNGLGKQLMEQALKQLGECPLITVSGQNLPQLLPLLKECGFHLSAVKKCVYNSQNTEYYFNDKKSDTIKNSLIPLLIHRMNQLRQRG